jgi:hypothetical protein
MHAQELNYYPHLDEQMVSEPGCAPELCGIQRSLKARHKQATYVGGLRPRRWRLRRWP